MNKLFCALIVGLFLFENAAAIAGGITPHPKDIDLPDVADQPTGIENDEDALP